MSIFSRLKKNIKRALNTISPILAIAAPFIPGIGPILGGVLGTVSGVVGATPPIRPAPTAPARPGIGSQTLERRTPRPVTRVQAPAWDKFGNPINAEARAHLAATGNKGRVLVGGNKTIMPIPGAAPPVHIPAAVPRPTIAIPPPSTSRTQQMSIFAALPALGGAIGRAAPAIGRAAGTVFRGATGRAATAAGLGVALGASLGGGGAGGNPCASGWHLNKQDGVGGPAGTYCVRNRRMNVGNARAARRSVRRLKGSRKLLRDIEKMMPTKTRARRAPAGHASHLHHTGS